MFTSGAKNRSVERRKTTVSSACGHREPHWVSSKGKRPVPTWAPLIAQKPAPCPASSGPVGRQPILRLIRLITISSRSGSCCTSHSATPELAKTVGASPQRRDTARPSLFVGRERELAELRAGLEDTLAGHGRLFLISGEPGIGKT